MRKRLARKLVKQAEQGHPVPIDKLARAKSRVTRLNVWLWMAGHIDIEEDSNDYGNSFLVGAWT